MNKILTLLTLFIVIIYLIHTNQQSPYGMYLLENLNSSKTNMDTLILYPNEKYYHSFKYNEKVYKQTGILNMHTNTLTLNGYIFDIEDTSITGWDTKIQYNIFSIKIPYSPKRKYVKQGCLWW